MHEYAIKLRAPVTTGNLPVMDVTAYIILSGDPFKYFNTHFWPREILETFDPKSGWHREIDAVNNQPPMGAV
jgi:hypothetical protein